MIAALRSFVGRWGHAYLSQLLTGRLRFPVAPGSGVPIHFVLVVANHFEPAWMGRSQAAAVGAVERWCRDFAALRIKDADGHPFKHTYFFAAEQYHEDLIAPLADHCATGFGEVEVHLHHGGERPDTAENLRRTLEDFRGRLVDRQLLARDRRSGRIGYCFVHGDWALANSASGKMCGVDNELEILAETGCYLDCTLPSAPNEAQVSLINAIYQCARPLRERAPHRSGIPLAVGQNNLTLPVLLEGPLLLTWRRGGLGLPLPRLENGDLSAEFPPTADRFRHWASTNIHVAGRPEWVFIKLHTHGLIDRHREALLGDPMKRALEEILASYNEGSRNYLHFATAREAANMIFAAVDGRTGNPGEYRDYRYVPLRER